jgi:GNAT superfamily N-acetyltransferase
MLELDFRTGGQAEIAFFGLIPGATGKGFGKWLMRRALQRAAGRRKPCVGAHLHARRPERAAVLHGAGVCFALVEVFPDPRVAGPAGRGTGAGFEVNGQ